MGFGVVVGPGDYRTRGKKQHREALISNYGHWTTALGSRSGHCFGVSWNPALVQCLGHCVEGVERTQTTVLSTRRGHTQRGSWDSNHRLVAGFAPMSGGSGAVQPVAGQAGHGGPVAEHLPAGTGWEGPRGECGSQVRENEFLREFRRCVHDNEV